MSAIVCTDCGNAFTQREVEPTSPTTCPECRSRTLAAGPALAPTQSAASDRTGEFRDDLSDSATIGEAPRGNDAGVRAAPALSGYDLLSEIGRGGMGVVYRARQRALDRDVAIKSLKVAAADDPSRLARFEQEARTVARLRHPNIVMAFDLLKHTGGLFLVMELLDGEDVNKRVERLGPLDEAGVWALVRQAAAGLSHAVSAGIVHRDIKPANMILVNAGNDSGGDASLLKVTDFGLALLASGPVGTQQLTQSGVLLGTPAYMAPEQFASSHVDWRADLYALGASAVYMLTGQPPYEQLSLWDIMKQKMEGDLPLPDKLTPASKALLAKMLARDPEQRFASYQELLDAIDQRDSGHVSRPSSRVKSRASGPLRWRWKPWAALVFVAVLMLTAVAVWFRTTREPMPPRMLPGKTLALFNGMNLSGWLVSNGNWQPAVDEEGGTVLAGSGTIRRPIPKMPYYRLLMGVDPRKAATVEIYFGLRSDTRRVLRLDADAVVLGEQAAEGGLQPIARKSRSNTGPDGPDSIAVPYRELRVERTPDGWFAYYHGQLVGRAASHDDELAEFRLRCEGHPAFFETIEFVELAVAE